MRQKYICVLYAIKSLLQKMTVQGGNMKYASEDLINEHEGILFGLKILEAMVNLLIDKKKIESSDLSEMVNFFKLFADKCHHGKEEGFLFPAMERAGIQKENGPIGQMLLEHVEGRKYISIMSESSGRHMPDTNNFIQASMAYIALLRRHIEKENTILFPMGDRMIPDDEQRQLLESFETFEDEVMGRGTHDKLHELLHDFEQKFITKE
jgi:hemerythrin-like domain-containing protein